MPTRPYLWLLAAGLSACGLDWPVPEEGGHNSPQGGRGAGAEATTSGGSAGSADGGAGNGSTGSGGGASTSSSAGGASSSSSGGTGGVPSCDMPSSTCDDCGYCAVDRGCKAQYDACYAECMSLWDCLLACTDQICVNDCYFAHSPAAANLFDAVQVCVVCDFCPNACAEFQQDWGC